ncbi:unnamed protein product [Discula destructiva]
MSKEPLELRDWQRRQDDAAQTIGAQTKTFSDDLAMSVPSSTPDEDKQPTNTHENEGWSNGRVISLISVDAQHIERSLGMIHMLWTSVFSILLCMALLLVNLSYSALSGLACLIVVYAIIGINVKTFYARHQATNAITDARISLTQEVLQAIRLIKYLGWEESFIERLAMLRSAESSNLQAYKTSLDLVAALGQHLPSLAGMISFVTFALGGHQELNVAIVFSSVALFSALLIPTGWLPGYLGEASAAWASLQKIEEYLLADEVEDLPVDQELKDAVEISEADFTWERCQSTIGSSSGTGTKSAAMPDQTIKEDRSSPTLRPSTSTTSQFDQKDDAGFHEQSSNGEYQFDAVSGWSLKEVPSNMTLRLAIQDEPPPPFALPSLSLSVQRGELLAVIGSIGGGKTSLLSALAGNMRKLSGSLTFSSPHRAYCPQTAWIQNTTVRENIIFGMEYDSTWYNKVIRACQLHRDLQMLPNGDATEIGERGINLSGGQKHRVSLARAVYSKAEILLLDDPLSAVDSQVGRALFEGAILGLLRGKTRILATHQAHVLKRCDRILWLKDGRIKALGNYETLLCQNPELSDLLNAFGGDQEESLARQDNVGVEHAARHQQELSAPQTPAKDDASLALMQVDDQAVGSVTWTVYKSFVASCRTHTPIILAVPFLCLAQGTTICCGLWLAWWASDRFGMARNTYVAVYVAITVAQGLFLFLFNKCISTWCVRSTNTMLEKAVENIMRAPISFFDTTPMGRITNRFSKDVEVMDGPLPAAIRLFLNASTMIVSILVLIIAFFPWFIIALVPCVLIFFLSAAYYRASARELTRHEAVLRSVVIARFSEALAGVSTIRTYSMQPNFSKSLRRAIDDTSSASFLTCASTRWLALRMDLIGITIIVACGALALVDRVKQSPAISGLVLYNSLSAMQVLQFTVRQWVSVEDAMSSTKQIYAYGNGHSLPVEGERIKPSADDVQGAIIFKNVRMRYRPGLPEVLCGLNLAINPGEHLAIVGRTGAGKSSLIGALFRTCELSGGSISIDGIDITEIPLKDLRLRLSIQPQDSILFRGSIRLNLDPFHEHSDEELWHALKGAWLSDTVHLDDFVHEEGSNFSHGQRQLLGLARLLVKDSKIVVCDEATSSVDFETDEKIQRTMLESFRGKTVLTVAHRIRTIVHYDRVCVMDNGRIAELGTPKELWDLGGIFKQMCEASDISRIQLQD